MGNTLTGKDILAALETDEHGPPTTGENALERAVSNGTSAVVVELHRLARNAHSTVNDVRMCAKDVESIIDEVRITLEAHGIHELPGGVGEGTRAGRDLIISRLRSLLAVTEKA